jgi:hypothetical protein
VPNGRSTFTGAARYIERGRDACARGKSTDRTSPPGRGREGAGMCGRGLALTGGARLPGEIERARGHTGLGRTVLTWVSFFL